VVDIAEQREGQPVLGLEALVRRAAVRAHAEDDGAPLLELGVDVAERARLLRAAGRVVAGIEVEDDRPAAQFREPKGGAVVGLELEVRCGLAGLDQSVPQPNGVLIAAV
jgi:hypothetical protein